MRFVLASASPARLATLTSAGFAPEVRVSGVDEDAALAAARADRGEPPHGRHVMGSSTADDVLVLARAKAEAVARDESGAVVLGCDSMLELDGRQLGKPADAAEAVERWRAMRGRSGVLHTGHWLVDTREPDRAAGATASTVVHFAELSDREIEAYVATGEPLAVAGAFTVDGLGGPFVTAIEGDYHAVVGVSLPLLRDLLGDLGLGVVDLWAR
ncbi:Maf family protein [Actinotalea fermentans]|uniref:Nucleoside triphosphate pyrophosphatase n=1 Tax=Actinotalea fermentans TaxID=43671 RepID=A0A511YWN9_9CELL|nr:nucleoside triphosphate pyrophosphatase [Actinotalea fermentans]KGM15528.1 septum formation inhibitor Maf [Actinotalea fermentans ATCC 43279 = JCM 9966 = DSM 3133]GEN79589.1 Maf-like protein [Actinotalea fermentans]